MSLLMSHLRFQFGPPRTERNKSNLVEVRGGTSASLPASPNHLNLWVSPRAFGSGSPVSVVFICTYWLPPRPHLLFVSGPSARPYVLVSFWPLGQWLARICWFPSALQVAGSPHLRCTNPAVDFFSQLQPEFLFKC